MLETIKSYYSPNLLWYEGLRYAKIIANPSNKQVAFTNVVNLSSIKKFGNWIYYSPSGEILKRKYYGEPK
jgi:hypothetical protein